MAYTYLISTGEFKAFVGTSIQLDDNWITSDLRSAQDTYINPLGKTDKLIPQDLYDELILQKSTNTMTAANLALMEHLSIYLAWRGAQETVGRQSGRIANIGVVSNSGTNEKPTDEWANYRQFFETKANTYKSMLIAFLDKNHDDYPLWPYSNCNTITGGSGGDTGIAYPNYMRRRVENIHRRRNN